MSKLRSVKGMHDILPEDADSWQFLESLYKDVVSRYGYREIRTPVVEPLDLFTRGIGEATDIVEKEMYAFTDKGKASLALRPEGTASVIRAYLQHNLGARAGVSKLFYVGPMFRRERPARGRYRQFYQAGAEMIGNGEPSSDAEIISMVVHFLEELGIKNLSVQINSLGDDDTRPVYRKALVDYFSSCKEKLCSDCVRRIDTNPLRILDCKVEGCKAEGAGAPVVLDYLSEAARTHFEDLKKLLDVYKVEYTVVPQMVRGLDYYTRTIFEVQGGSDILGAQATLVGGGRYNGLVKELGGRPTDTVGFAFGVERLLLMLGEDASKDSRKSIYVAGVGEGGFERTVELSTTLRKWGFNVEAPYRLGSLRSQMKQADKCGAVLAVIGGEEEFKEGSVTLKNLESGEQEIVEISKLKSRIVELL